MAAYDYSPLKKHGRHVLSLLADACVRSLALDKFHFEQVDMRTG